MRKKKWTAWTKKEQAGSETIDGQKGRLKNKEGMTQTLDSREE